jgi:hypothetical protein
MDKVRMRVAGVEFEVGDVEQAKKLMELNLVTENKMSPEIAKQFIQAVHQVFTNLNPDTQRIEKLRAACGYVENGTSGSVQISQDDATKNWSVVGSNAKTSTWGDGLRDAIDKLEICDD